jgi:hypothetical protein
MWKAESPQELGEISRLVHDAYFDFDDVIYDAAAEFLTVPFLQEWEWPPLDQDPDWQDAPRTEVLGKTWRYTEQRVPFMRGSLHVMHVESVSLDSASGDAAMLRAICYDTTAGQLTIEGVSGDLTARVTRLQITAELRPDEIGLRVRRRVGFVGTSDTPLWNWPPDE